MWRCLELSRWASCNCKGSFKWKREAGEIKRRKWGNESRDQSTVIAGLEEEKEPRSKECSQVLGL